MRVTATFSLDVKEVLYALLVVGDELTKIIKLLDKGLLLIDVTIPVQVSLVDLLWALRAQLRLEDLHLVTELINQSLQVFICDIDIAVGPVIRGPLRCHLVQVLIEPAPEAVAPAAD